MPTFWGASGSATVARTETAMLTGTATVTATPSVYVSGTATVDRTSVAAWAARVRRTCTRVFLGDAAEDMARIQGDVGITLEKDSPAAMASFQLTDPRCAYFATGSLAQGGIPVSIRVRVATELAESDDMVFRGVTEAAPNTGANVTTATIQCAGEGAEWLEERGCLSLPAFAGYTRLEILKAFVEAAGIDSTRVHGGEDWPVVSLGMDLSGLSPWELAGRFCELEDCYRRIEGGDLYLIPAREVIGALAVPVFDFTPDNFLSVAETPPNRPITKYVLSAVGVPEEILAGGSEETTPEIVGGTDSAGKRWETKTLTTTVNGVTVSQRIEEWKDVEIPGVTPSASAFRLWKLTVTETDWGTVTVGGVALRTARIVEQRTTVTEWYSAPCRTASGYVWSDGTRHLANAATWQVTSTEVTTSTYDAAPSCLLTAKTTRRGGWYSEIVVSGQVYDGGEERADNAYLWISDAATPPFELTEETYAEETSDTLKAVLSETVTSGWRVPPGSASVAELWGEREGSRTRWQTTPGSGVISEATAEFFVDGSTKYASKIYSGTLPALARAADDIPQFRTVPLVLTAEADGSGLAVSPHTETPWGAESMRDLENVARQRLRHQQSPTVTISHPANPHLRLIDVITVTDPTRELDEQAGFIVSERFTFNASTTGVLRGEPVVMFPLSQFDPPTEAA